MEDKLIEVGTGIKLTKKQKEKVEYEKSVELSKLDNADKKVTIKKRIILTVVFIFWQN